jgi:hypothetical protein
VPGLGDDADKIRHNGMHHCAFEYASFADLMSSYDRLRKAGVEPAFCLDHGVTISIYYEDPEGNYVELQSDNFSDWKLSTEYMRTSRAFSENPIGVFWIWRGSTRPSSPVPISGLCREMVALAVICPSRFQTSDYRRRSLSLAQSAQARLRTRESGADVRNGSCVTSSAGPHGGRVTVRQTKEGPSGSAIRSLIPSHCELLSSIGDPADSQ